MNTIAGTETRLDLLCTVLESLTGFPKDYYEAAITEALEREGDSLGILTQTVGATYSRRLQQATSAARQMIRARFWVVADRGYLVSSACPKCGRQILTNRRQRTRWLKRLQEQIPDTEPEAASVTEMTDGD